MLPEIKNVSLQPNIFPTKWQAVLFHNYGFVPSERLADLLGCDVDTIEREAARLGLKRDLCNPIWLQKGYITLIRNNWYLLPYIQLCKLLDINEIKLDYILQNDDFLSVKLGDYKPNCDTVSYQMLTPQQIEQTKALSTQVVRYLQLYKVKPFDFFQEELPTKTSENVENSTGKRIIHGYLSPCGDAFIEDSTSYLPEILLKKYATLGINGIWLQGVLSTLSSYPFDESLSKDYPIRRKNLQRLIRRCERYGIKVYLYFNEPRALPENKFGKYAHLMGRRENGYAALCFERKETREYLYNAVKDLLCDLQGLGGIITITMSENLTHCNYRPHTNCPICKHIPPEKSASAVNNVIRKAIRDSGSNAELIANLWGWSPFMEWTEEQTLRGVELLNEDISVTCVSEYDLSIEKGGIKSKVIDYSISNPGPSEITKKILKKARETGHNVYAKIQTNNSWECSAVPYLPVFDLLYQHLKNLSAIGVKNYMLTWTLGGYPSPMLGLVAEYEKNPQTFDIEEWYKNTFEEESQTVREAVRCFCNGFREYPFSIDSLYFSPKTLGSANLWSLENMQKKSTMVCYAFDDYEAWIKPYPLQTYLSQYEKLLQEWEKGCRLLEKTQRADVKELRIFAEATYTHFKSDYLQTKFSYFKRDKEKYSKEIKTVLTEEKANARQLLKLVYQNACIGFEASNHYYYTDRNLIEKIILMDKLSNSL